MVSRIETKVGIRAQMTSEVIYVVGGTVQAGDGIYIARSADRQLFEHCRRGDFVYILTSRQTGKSSLMIRTAEHLIEENVRAVIIDLQKLGVPPTADQWYRGIVSELEDQLELATDARQWWNEHGALSQTERLNKFLQEVVLEAVREPIVIFIDEIDTTLALDYTDDFFITIRYLYGLRASRADLKRLSFVLIGVATPGSLIKDSRRTPFNIGHLVDLSDFTLSEATPLVAGLRLPSLNGQSLLERVLDWTGGHPFLTLSVFRSLQDQPVEQWNDEAVDQRIGKLFFEEPNIRNDTNLQFVREMLTRKATDPDRVLSLYAKVSEDKDIQDSALDRDVAWLKLAGIVRTDRGLLRVRNRVYDQVFPSDWARRHISVNWNRRLLKVGVGLITLLVLVTAGLAPYAFYQRSEALRLAEAETEARLAAQAAQKLELMARVEAEDSAVSALRQRNMARKSEAAAQEAKTQAEFARMEAEKAAWDEVVARENALTQAGIAAKNQADAQEQRSLAEERLKQAQQSAKEARASQIEAAKARANEDAATREAERQRRIAQSGQSAQLAALSAQELLRSEITAVGSRADFDRFDTTPALTAALASLEEEVTKPALEALRSAVETSYTVRYKSGLLALDVSPNGSAIVAASANDTVIVELDSNEATPFPHRNVNPSLTDVLTFGLRSGIRRLWQSAVQSACVSYSPNGALVASSGSGRQVQIWSVREQKVTNSFRAYDRGAKRIAFDRGSRRVVVVGFGTAGRILDVGRGTRSRLDRSRHVTAVAFSRESGVLATANTAGNINLWDVQSGKRTRSFQTDAFPTDAPVSAMAFGPWPRLAVVRNVSGKHTVEVWTLEGAGRRKTLGQVFSMLSDVAFSPDGELVLAVGPKTPPILWEWDSESFRLLPDRHEGDITGVEFIEDRHMAVSTGTDGTIRVYLLGQGYDEFPDPSKPGEIEQLKELACQQIDRSLTPEECQRIFGGGCPQVCDPAD